METFAEIGVWGAYKIFGGFFAEAVGVVRSMGADCRPLVALILVIWPALRSIGPPWRRIRTRQP